MLQCAAALSKGILPIDRVSTTENIDPMISQLQLDFIKTDRQLRYCVFCYNQFQRKQITKNLKLCTRQLLNSHLHCKQKLFLLPSYCAEENQLLQYIIYSMCCRESQNTAQEIITQSPMKKDLISLSKSVTRIINSKAVNSITQLRIYRSDTSLPESVS